LPYANWHSGCTSRDSSNPSTYVHPPANVELQSESAPNKHSLQTSGNLRDRVYR
jgi:hypothetical protein